MPKIQQLPGDINNKPFLSVAHKLFQTPLLRLSVPMVDPKEMMARGARESFSAWRLAAPVVLYIRADWLLPALSVLVGPVIAGASS
jgi:hypothetical protein